MEVHKLSLRDSQAAEESVIQRAIRFAYTPADIRTIRRLCHECGVIWPPCEYTLRIERSMGGWIPRLRRLARLTRTTKESALLNLDRARRNLQRTLELLIDLIEGKEEVAVATAPVGQIGVIAEMIDAEGSLPGEVLASYAMSLLLDTELPWRERVKRCAGCGQAFLAPKTGGRLANSHPECRAKARAQYMSDYRSQSSGRKRKGE